MPQSEDMDDCCNPECQEGSSFYTAITLMRYPLGISLFLLPWAMKFGGIIAGPIFILVFIVFNAYRSFVLTKVTEELTESGVTAPAGYSDWWLLENCLGKIQRTSINCYMVMFSTLQWISLLGHACTFLAFAGLTFDQQYPNMGWHGINGERICIGICVAAVIVTHVITQLLRNFFHDSKNVCINFLSGSFFVTLPVLIAVFLGIPIVVAFVASLLKHQVIDPPITVDGLNFGLLFAGLMFIVGATPDDVTAPYGSHKNKSTFPTVLFSLGVVYTVLLAGLGIAVFLAFERETCGSVTFNLPLTEMRQFSALRLLSALAALIFVAFRHQIEPKLSARLSTAEIFCDIVFKVIFLALAGALAVGIPTFSGLACLFGSVSSFSLTLTFPFISDLMLHVTGGRTASRDLDDEGRELISEGPIVDSDRTISAARVARDVIFMALGLAGMIYGLYNTVIYLQYNGVNGSTDGCAYVATNATMILP